MLARDVYDDGLNGGGSVEDRIALAVETLNAPTFEISAPVLRKHRDVFVLQPGTWEEKLYLRHVCRKLKLAYKIRPTDRNTVIRQIRSILQSDSALRILRTDVKSFYRSIDVDPLVASMNRDGLLRFEELRAIETVMRTARERHIKGLPWGLSVSAVLAEVAMRQFDSEIWRINGLFYYRRFVDDIIVIAPASCAPLLPEVQKLLPQPLRLSSVKTREIFEEFSAIHSTTSFEYLGYRFTRDLKLTGSKRTMQAATFMAPSRVERMKMRVDLSIEQFKKDGNFFDLTGRLKMLTGNYTIKKPRHPSPIPVGIYYNYRFIDNHDSLKILDQHLRQHLVALRILLRKQGKSYSQLKKLLKLSFLRGWDDCRLKSRFRHRISKARISKYRKIWANA